MVDEQTFIKALAKQFKVKRKDVLLGIGDDGAVLTNGLVLSCDTQVEGVHFKRAWITPYNLGRRAVAVTTSDIAAMGGVPSFLLLSLGIPKHEEQIYMNQLMKGVRLACENYRLSLIGGNLTRAKELFIDCFILGKTKGVPVARKGALAGDVILLTGTLGKQSEARMKGKLLVPKARVEEGIIARKGGATAMIDVSDGLAKDVHSICDASDVGACIFADKLPRPSSVPIDLALSGGEDCELCFTAPPTKAGAIASSIKSKTGTDVSVIGEILPKRKGRWLRDKNGKEVALRPEGWDHFSR